MNKQKNEAGGGTLIAVVGFFGLIVYFFLNGGQ